MTTRRTSEASHSPISRGRSHPTETRENYDSTSSQFGFEPLERLSPSLVPSMTTEGFQTCAVPSSHEDSLEKAPPANKVWSESTKIEEVVCPLLIHSPVGYHRRMGRGRVDFDRGIARLASYARHHGHASPKATEIWLEWSVGLWVSALRTKFRSGKLTAAQIIAAEEIGVRFVPPYRDPKPKPPTRAERQERDFLDKLTWLEDYFRQYGHINVPQLDGTAKWPTAGRWIARLRSSYRRGTLPSAVIRKAEQMKISWNPGPGKRTW